MKKTNQQEITTFFEAMELIKKYEKTIKNQKLALSIAFTYMALSLIIMLYNLLAP